MSSIHEDIAKTRDYFTAKLSDGVRQLDFAGIGVIWIIKSGGQNAGGITFSKFLLWPLLFFVLSLAFDLMHYGYGSYVWDREAMKGRNSTLTPDQSIKLGRKARFFFWMKAGICGIAYLLLIFWLGERLLGY